MNKRPTDAEAELIRRMDRAMRRLIPEMFPDLLPALEAKYPEQFGPDSWARIRRDFPDLFGDAKPKP